MDETASCPTENRDCFVPRNDGLSTISYHLSAISYQLPATNHQLPATSYQLSPILPLAHPKTAWYNPFSRPASTWRSYYFER
ncbi:MAG TPA: hypothetical protein DCL08_00130 [Anaerolineaceae bacterium]|nr:hypothetical protein [Anaerolineaceae bacterium]